MHIIHALFTVIADCEHFVGQDVQPEMCTGRVIPECRVKSWRSTVANLGW